MPSWTCIAGCGAQQETIVSLVPSGGAITQIHGTWFTSVRPGHHVTVTAVTAPHNAGVWANLQWQNAMGGGGQTATVARAAAGPVRVTASLDNDRSVDLHFVELTTLVSTTGTNTAADTWKCWVRAGGFADVVATPNPNWYRYRNEFTWTWADAGAHAGANAGVAGRSARRRRIPLDHGGDTITVTATLYEDSKTITIRVCQPPVLQLQRLQFDGHVVACDERGHFDRIWERGRIEADPAAGVVNPSANNINSVLCFTSGGAITITATFNVTTAPTDPEVVTVRGRARIGGTHFVWEQVGLAVPAAAAPVTTAPMVSAATLPVRVGCYDDVVIRWEMDGPDGNTTDLGQTTHQVYTLLAAPVAPQAGATGALGMPTVYWTLLEFSCRPAHGATTAAQMVSRSYSPLKGTTGDGNGPRRARDRQRLSYWLQGINSAPIFTTGQLLNTADGGGRCGSWAHLLVNMWALHGEAARISGVHPQQNPVVDHWFLVKNCSFGGNGNAAAAPWTHTGHHVAAAGRCAKNNGVAGQGKSNPTFVFKDHAIVEYNGQVYDPSYGLDVHPTVLSWEKAAIAGMGHIPVPVLAAAWHNFGGNLRIPAECSRGFLEHTVGGGQTLAAIAALYGTTANALWNHAYNQALRALRAGGMATIAAGDTVIIPRRGTNIAILRRV